jgi:hypothetical protein
MPAHAAQCSPPSGPTILYALARPPFVRACACQRAIAGGVASSPSRYHAPVPVSATCGAPRQPAVATGAACRRCTSSPLPSSRRTPRWCVVTCCCVCSSVDSGQRCTPVVVLSCPLHSGRQRGRCSSPPPLDIRCRRRLYRTPEHRLGRAMRKCSRETL